MDKVRWGILGTGHMAAIMAAELSAMQAEGVELVAVASRSAQTAEDFAAQNGIRQAWGDYAALATDDQVDVVYIATPPSLHHENMLSCLRGAKSVLCEKPFTINAQEARRVIDEARHKGVFVMEAMWTRFLPAIVAARALLSTRTIGRVQMIVGGGAFVPDVRTGHYLLRKELGGGVLLDAGVYLVSMASMILGTPSRVHASGIIGSSGVDEQDAILLDHPDGSTALLYVSLRTRRSPDLEILGESGRFSIAAPIFRPAKLSVWTRDGVATTTEFPITGTGYGYQIREVVDALRTDRLESTIMPLDETLSIMQTMDWIRDKIGLRYTGEHQ